MTIATQPNELPAVPMEVENRLDLPACCPISGNPLSGSAVSIRYTPGAVVLEVASLREYIDSYVGGRGEIRSMEAMIQQIAADCRAVLGVAVEVVADLVIAPEQRMVVRVHSEQGIETGGEPMAEEREMWSWEDGEPVREMWRPWGVTQPYWVREAFPKAMTGGPRLIGENLWPTREAAIRHAIEEANGDREVLVKALAEIQGKIARLTGMLEEGREG